MKEYVSVNVKNGFILSTSVSRASEHDTTYFSNGVANSLPRKEIPPNVFVAKGYCGETNWDLLNMDGIGDGIILKD